MVLQWTSVMSYCLTCSCEIKYWASLQNLKICVMVLVKISRYRSVIFGKFSVSDSIFHFFFFVQVCSPIGQRGALQRSNTKLLITYTSPISFPVWIFHFPFRLIGTKPVRKDSLKSDYQKKKKYKVEITQSLRAPKTFKVGRPLLLKWL